MEPRIPRVLVVDHNMAVADTFLKIFEMAGYQAVAVCSGEDAIAVALDYRPDVVLLEVMLPGDLNGIEVAQILVKANPQCRTILCSGRPETAELVDQARAWGNVVEVLAKPVHPSVILSIVADSLPEQSLSTRIRAD